MALHLEEGGAREALLEDAIAFALDWVKHEKRSAVEFLQAFEEAFGFGIRIQVGEVLSQLAESHRLSAAEREYLTTTVAPEELDRASRGGKAKRLHDISSLDELFRRMVQFRSSAPYLEAIRFLSRLREYAPYNNMLVFLQRPTARYWATAPDWSRKFGRDILQEAIPIVMLRPMGPIMLVYELDDTKGPPLPPHLLEPFAVDGALKPRVLARLLKECRREGIVIRGQRMSGGLAGVARRQVRLPKARFFIDLNKAHSAKEQFVTLCHELAHLYLGHLGAHPERLWTSRLGLRRAHQEFEAEAVAHIITTRLGLAARSAEYLAAYLSKPSDFERISVDMVMKVASRIEHMALGQQASGMSALA